MGHVSSIVPFAKVRPFQAQIDPPFPGESLLGFVTRALSISPVKQLQRGLALAGLATGAPASIATTLVGDREVAGVATLLRTTPDEIRQRTYADAPLGHNRRDMIEFFGVPMRAHYRESKIRRVSPQALKIGPYHRAVWELRPFSFDPQTRGRLIDTCPVCDQKLGWSRAQGPAMCDRCVDGSGFPNVDLRDFPQPVVEVDDDEALAFVTNLVDPDPDRRAAARRLLPKRWTEFSNGDLFETVMAFASGLTMDPSSSKHAQGRAKNGEHFSRLTPEMLALAGRAIIGRESGFSALAARYRLDVDKRPSFYGRRKELGPLAYIVHDKHVEPKIRKLVDEMVDADMARSAQTGETTVRRAERKAERLASAPNDGFLNIVEFASRYGVIRRRLQWLAESGLVRTIRASDAARSPVRMAIAEVEPLLMMLPDAIAPVTAAGLLGIPTYALQGLADRKLIRKLDGPILGLMKDREGYSRASIERLVSRLRERAPTPAPKSAVRLSRAVRSTSHAMAQWDAVISAIVDGDVEVCAVPTKAFNARHGFAVVDVPAFAVAVRKRIRNHGSLDNVEWVNVGTASEILNVTEVFVYVLLQKRPDLLKAKRAGQTSLLREDVSKLAQEYVFVPEICERARMGSRRACVWLRKHGIDQVIELKMGKYFGFRRPPVEKVLTKKEAQYAPRRSRSTEPAHV